MFQVVCLNYSIMNSRCFSQIVTSLICLESSGINLKDDSDLRYKHDQADQVVCNITKQFYLLRICFHRARNPGNKLGNNSIYNVKDQF